MSSGACHTVSLARSLIWSLVGLKQLRTSRERVQRERKNPLSRPADTFESYQCGEGAWKESRAARGARGRPSDPADTGGRRFKRCPVGPTRADGRSERRVWMKVQSKRMRTAGSNISSEPAECGNDCGAEPKSAIHRAPPGGRRSSSRGRRHAHNCGTMPRSRRAALRANRRRQ